MGYVRGRGQWPDADGKPLTDGTGCPGIDRLAVHSGTAVLPPFRDKAPPLMTFHRRAAVLAYVIEFAISSGQLPRGKHVVHVPGSARRGGSIAAHTIDVSFPD